MDSWPPSRCPFQTKDLAMTDRIARRGQVCLGLLWLIDGVLQCQPYMFGRSFITGVLLPSAAGQPRFISALLTWMAHLIEPQVAAFNALAAATEVLIGIGLLYRRTVRPALVVSLVWASGIWLVGEGAGMVLTGTASPLTGAPGAALLYVLAGLLCWPRSAPRYPTADDDVRGLVPDRYLRLAWGMTWLGSAVLWLLPANSSADGVHQAITGAPSGAGWLSRVLDAAAAATAGRGTTIAIVLAVASGAIGLAVLQGWHPHTLLALQVSLSALYWVLGQGLGGVLTGHATDVGTSPPMILIAAMLANSAARTHTRTRFIPRLGEAGWQP